MSFICSTSAIFFSKAAAASESLDKKLNVKEKKYEIEKEKREKVNGKRERT